MKKAFAFVASSVALLGAQTASASEAFIAPAATSPWVFTGTVDVFKGIALTCNVELEITGPENASDTPSGPFSHTDVDNLSATVTLSGGLFGLCSSVIVSPVGPGSVTYTSSGSGGGTFALNNVVVTTITPGNCAGTLYGVWDENAQSLDVSGTLPAQSGADCTIEGTLGLDTPTPGNASGAGDADHGGHQT